MEKTKIPTLEEIRSQSMLSLQTAFETQSKSCSGYKLFVDAFKGFQYHAVWSKEDFSKCLFILIMDIREPDGLLLTREV